MTGATRGIGRAAAAEILRKDPTTHLVLLGREESGRRTVNELLAISPHITLVATDLASRDSISAAGRVVNGMLDRHELPALRGFAGNAGVQFIDALHTTPDGYETTFAVNVLANHLLLHAFGPRFGAGARIVITVSDTHFGDFRHTGGLVPAPRWSAPETLARPSAFPDPATVRAGRTAYSTSKLAAIYLVHEWAGRLPPGRRHHFLQPQPRSRHRPGSCRRPGRPFSQSMGASRSCPHTRHRHAGRGRPQTRRRRPRSHECDVRLLPRPHARRAVL